MMRSKSGLGLLVAPWAIAILLGGCASTAKTVVTTPFKAAGKVVDWTTTSQEEADRNRGKKLRERDQRLGKLEKQRQQSAKRCDKGDQRQCQRAQLLSHEIDALMSARL